MENSVNEHLSQIFQQTNQLKPGVKILEGLDAVYADLVLLRILRGARTVSHGHGYMPHTTNFMTANGSGSFPQQYVYPRYSNADYERYREDERYVSIAELQLASKIASGGTLTLKNLKNKDKMHFEEANPLVDDISWHLLHNVLYLCDNPHYKGGEYEPIL